jgi:ABC-type transport system involved in cytochrome c biogenesis permease subunit
MDKFIGLNNLTLFYLVSAGYLGLLIARLSARVKPGYWLLIPVWLVHTAFLSLRFWLSGHPPLSGLFEPLNFFAWCILTLLIINFTEPKLSIPALFIAMLLMLAAALAGKQIRPLPPALETLWFELHVASAFIAYACFALAASACICGENLKLGLRFTAWGLMVFSASLLAGGIWAYLAWADYWVWSPKELWSILIWVYYATVLHAARLAGWRRRVVGMLVFGFLLLMFTYLGVGLLMKSSHQL